MKNMSPDLNKYLLHNVIQYSFLLAVNEERAPRRLGFGCFILNALEGFDNDPDLRQIKLKVVAIPEVRSKLPLSIWIQHHVVLEKNGVPDRSFDIQEISRLLPFSALGNGVFALEHDDPLVVAARQEQDPIRLEALLFQIGLHMDRSIDAVGVVHDLHAI